tara:strand:- start:184 stop:795 length:612 start_codon:yes stop_codon:yes gene_type:complete
MRKTIFPVSYYQGQVENNERLKKDLLPFINRTKKNLTPPEGWLTTNITTSHDRDDINRLFLFQGEMRRQYHDVLKTFFDNKFDIKVDECWYNCYENEEYQESHNHVGDPLDPTHFACVHFLCYDKQVHSPLSFLDPLEIIRSHSLEFDSHNYDFHHIPDINEGDLIMFPSYLMHEVKATKPTPGNPRITISFNFAVTKYNSKI